MLSAAPPLHPPAGGVRPVRGLRRLPALAAVVAVVMVHAWLLSSVPVRDRAGLATDAPGPPPGPRPPAALQTRTVALAPLPAEPTPAPTRAAVPLPVPVPVPVPVTVAGSRPRPAAASPPIVPAAATGPAAPAASAASADAAPQGIEVPTYRTRPAPAALLSYALQRGSARGGVTHGAAELVWAPADRGYVLSLQGSASGAVLIGSDSRGGFDAAGIAPERFLDRRRGRDAQAANFRRDSGRITFSGPSTALPLAPGTQDRLTWMLQLPAIVDAAPARFEPGAQVAMWVVGARGDVGVWTFVVEVRETIDVPAGSVVGALRLTREPHQPYDTRIEVWLDPARHHLPAKVRMSIPQTGDMTEFAMLDARFP
jgi:hypothetical protein